MWWPFSTSADLPPTKRRRGLAGSIVSTAWSAALMGTAVGLTVYRLWRDRGRNEDEFDPSDYAYARKRRASAAVNPDDMSISRSASEPPSPPPPYNQEWTAVDYPNQSNHYSHSRPTLNVPTTPRGRDKAKPKPTPRSARKTGSIRAHQGHKSRKAAPFVRTVPAASSTRHYDQPEAFDVNMNPSISANGRRFPAGNNDEEDVDVEEQMDWIGGKLAQLIEEGKRALGTEVVVMSDAKEDEVDDGSGAWVSDDEDTQRRGLKRRGSSASTRYHHHSRSTAASSTSVHQYPQISVSTSTPPRQNYGMGMPASPARSHHIVEDTCDSPEVREMMERARAKLAGRNFVR
ncbi:hypothetical protein H1R20_g11334, partial [Candolleomyces eurysporus]